MSHHPWFGALRSAAHQPPSLRAWEAICDALEDAPDHALAEQAIPYVNDATRRWPDALRIARARWLHWAQHEPKRQPLLRAARVIDGLPPTCDVSALPSLLTGCTLHTLRLSDAVMDDELANALLDAPAAHTLRALALPCAPITAPALATLLRLPQLQALKLDCCIGEPDALCEALTLEPRQALRELGLASWALSQPQHLHMLLHHPHLAQVSAWQLQLQSCSPKRFATMLTRPAGCAPIQALHLQHEVELHPPSDNPLLIALGTLRLPALHTLSLSDLHAPAQALERLLRPSQLPALRALSLRLDYPSALAAPLRAIIPQLDALSLRRAQLNDKTLPSLLGNATNLTRLALPSNMLGPHAAHALRPLTRLRHLDLSDNTLHDLSALASPTLRLETLDLSACDVGEETLRALAERGCLSATHTLHLDDNPRIGDAGAMALASAPLHALEHLELGGCEVGYPGVVALLQAPGFAPTSLSLHSLHDARARIALLSAPQLATTRELGLDRTARWDQASARALTRAPHLRALRQLALSPEALSPEDARELCQTPWLDPVIRAHHAR